MTKILVSSNPKNLEAAIAGLRSVTVEAEYGSVVVKGSVETRAHHVPEYAHLPSPCQYGNDEAPRDVEVIGLSHMDLDSAAGALAVLGLKPVASSFWGLAGFVDVRGPHRIGETAAKLDDLEALHAFWAWSNDNRFDVPRDGSVVDCTEYVMRVRGILLDIFGELRAKPGGGSLIQAGRDAQAAQAELNRASFLDENGGVILRSSGEFVNHLYATPDGKAARAVVAFNPEKGTVTVSLADASAEDVNCREFVQRLWGPLAGGHAGIAGSPRELQMLMADAEEAAELLAEIFSR